MIEKMYDKGGKLKKKYDLPIVPEMGSKKAKRNRKKTGPYISPSLLCPFCSKELPLDKEKVEHASKERRFYFDWDPKLRVDTCPICEAYKVPLCPSCRRSTWYKDEIYKHQTYGCGFTGRRIKNV